MNWFRRKPATTEAPPPLTPAERWELVNEEYRAAEKAYNEACQELQKYLSQHPDRISMFNSKVFIAVNAMRDEDPQRRRLEKNRMEKLSRRNSFLARRAELLTQGVHHEQA